MDSPEPGSNNLSQASSSASVNNVTSSGSGSTPRSSSTRRKISMPWFRQSSFGISLTRFRLPKQHTIAATSDVDFEVDKADSVRFSVLVTQTPQLFSPFFGKRPAQTKTPLGEKHLDCYSFCLYCLNCCVSRGSCYNSSASSKDGSFLFFRGDRPKKKAFFQSPIFPMALFSFPSQYSNSLSVSLVRGDGGISKKLLASLLSF